MNRSEEIIILHPPSPLQLFSIFLRMRTLKLFNYLGTGALFRKPQARPARTGTHSRFSTSAGFSILFFTLMSFTAFGFHAGQLQMMSEKYAKTDLIPSREYWEILAVYFLLMSVSALCLTLGTSDFKKTEWDLEWLVTLPISKKALMGLRILERTVASPILILAVVPPVVLSLLKLGHGGWFSAVTGILLALPVLTLAASIQTVLDTGVRLHWRPARIKNLQALTNIAGAALFYLVSLSGNEVSPILIYFQEKCGSIILFSPVGALIQAIYSNPVDLRWLALFLTECLAAALLFYFYLLFLLKEGVVNGSGQVSVRRGVGLSTPLSAPQSFRFFSAFSIREFRMLTRDHQYLSQTILAPLLILLLQVYFLWKSKGHLFTEARSGAAVAFGMVGYSMMSSCYLCVVTEGPALWIFYTFPKTLSSLIFEKVKKWGWLAVAYVLLFLGWCASQTKSALDFEFFQPFCLAILGIPVLVVIATSLGILGFEGTSVSAQRRMKPSATYIYLLTLAAFVGCIFIPSYSRSFLALIMMGLVAAAFWQKAAVRLPFLLDPGSIPKPTASLADGIIAAQIFFLLENLFTLIQMNQFFPASNLVTFNSFGGAGLVTYGLLRFYYRAVHARELPQIFPLKFGLSFVLATGAAILCLSLQCYLWTHVRAPELLLSYGFAQASWGILGAPLCEEFIFRGLIYQGLRRHFNQWASVLIGSLLFALIHPASSILPAFGLGIASSILVEVTGSLGASLFLRAIYFLGLMLLTTQLSQHLH